MIEIILILFILLVCVWIYKEFKNAAKEYNPFEDTQNWTYEEQKIIDNYKKENLK